MPYRANYPATVAEVLDPAARFKPAALRAVRALARSKPWRGTLLERIDKFHACLAALARAYGIEAPALVYGGGVACYVPGQNVIRLPRLSVVTLLHEFGHARGFDERQTCRWSINLFRRCFPRSFARCRPVRHMLIMAGRRPNPGRVIADHLSDLGITPPTARRSRGRSPRRRGRRT